MFKRIIHSLMFFSIVILPVSCGLLADVEIDNVPEETNNVNLSSLEVSAGVLSPVFNQSVTQYSVEVEYAITSLSISARTADSTCRVSINGINFYSNEGTQSISLNEGINSINVIASASDGATNKTYNVSITRLPAPTKANLSALTISSGALSPSFNAYSTSYIVYIYNTLVTAVTVTPTVAEAGALVKVNNISVTSGSVSQPITLNPDITNIVVRVTSQDLTLIKDYNIKIYYMDDPVRVGNWPLISSYINTENGVSGYWKGTWNGGLPDLSAPEYVNEGGRTGLHFRYSANGLYVEDGNLFDANGNLLGDAASTDVSGNWVDCEKNVTQNELNVEDYLTVSLWFFWDTGVMKDYKGNDVEEDEIIINNIISKSVFWNYGWQIRHEQNSSESVVYLYLHSNGEYAKLPIISNFSEHRGHWVHIAVTIDNVNNEVITYVNGEATSLSPQSYTTHFARVPFGYTPELDYTGHFSIGAFSHPWGGYSVNGKINDVQFYHGVIDSSGAANLYNFGHL